MMLQRKARSERNKAKAFFKKAQVVRKKPQASSRKARALKRKTPTKSRTAGRKVTFSKKRLKEDILREAKVLGRHMGAAEAIAEKVAEDVAKWAKDRTLITEEDLTREASKKLEKYDADLAYIYKNYGKII